MAEIKPFRINVPQESIDDLIDRLGRTRWPDEWEPASWDYGVPLAFAKQLARQWREEYDWRALEARLNSLPQFTTTIDGQNVHFLHIKSPHQGALPLILTHGWPMSIVEYLDLAALLADPAAHGADATDAFDVVIPSVPGYGFSGPVKGPGWNSYRVAQAWAELMSRLGYETFGAHGNDVGSLVSPHLGRVAPERVVGAHVTQVFSFPSGDPAEFANLTPDDYARLEFLQRFDKDLLAFSKLQSSVPQTIGFALHDSPVAQLAWSANLFREEVDPQYILDNVTLYWLTGTGASAARYYWDDAHTLPADLEPTTGPIGVSVFANDFKSIRAFADRDHKNITFWREHDSGGHFAPKQEPDLLANDLRDFFRPLR